MALHTTVVTNCYFAKQSEIYTRTALCLTLKSHFISCRVFLSPSQVSNEVV